MASAAAITGGATVRPLLLPLSSKAMMGLIYFLFVAFNSDEGSGGSGGSGGSKTRSNEDPVEEARRIMEKYK
ncbi:hypothetical protein FCM35_KLT19970 [Carex littledalei]|uniref:Uncharacterized protein n=1 Tax=Carex littledalei TaxID=544730 RepID=A0A833R9I3_9POAL|nr:hypothetical protein FCM35_KLT19970 [Carex littledalei]